MVCVRVFGTGSLNFTLEVPAAAYLGDILAMLPGDAGGWRLNLVQPGSHNRLFLHLPLARREALRYLTSQSELTLDNASGAREARPTEKYRKSHSKLPRRAALP